MNIKNNYIDNTGQIYEVRNVNFENLQDFRKAQKKFISESSNNGSSLSEDGIYLYKSSYDETKGLRVYKDINLYQYTHHCDDKIVFELQKRQKNIKLSQLPTGILTIENKIVGQEVPLYENSKTIYDYFKEGNMKKRPTQFYLEILYILRELYNEGITYKDAHRRNFLVENITEIVNIIDFEDQLVDFSNLQSTYDTMIINFKTYLIDKLNYIVNVCFGDDYKKAKTLEQLEEVLLEEDYKFKLKIK